MEIFSGATMLGIVDLLVLDVGSLNPDLVSLTGYTNVTRLVISSTDFGGLLYDDFSFSLANGQQRLPEPATALSVAFALGAAGVAMRRRKTS